jgi:hypothetical protein
MSASQLHSPSFAAFAEDGIQRHAALQGSVTIFRSPYEGPVDSSSRLVPGAIAPRSGVYRVHHYAHRMPHSVTVTAGTVLPECRRCGDKVRFAPMIPAEPISNDVDFLDQDFAA